MAPRDRPPSSERPPDLEIGATVRADRLRFGRRPKVRVVFRGNSLAKSRSAGERENVPDRAEPGVTYRNARVGWSAAAWVEEDVEGATRTSNAGHEQES